MNAMGISYKVIGRHIHDARKSQKLTQEAMAEMLKMSVAHYGRLERGERLINLERLSQISCILHVPLTQLVAGCIPDSSIISENTPESIFLWEMEKYAHSCSQAMLDRMCRVCAALAIEENN